MEEEFYDVLYGYLTRGVYPNEYNTNKKRSLRRKAVHYSVDNGELFYIGGKIQPRRVIKDEEEKRRILESCHAETGGTALH